MLNRNRWTIALGLALALVAAACGGDDSDASGFDLVSAGTLTVCTDSPYPPMEFEQDGEFTGFDIELMRAIADELGLGLSVVNSGFDPITSGAAMIANTCDIAAASITINEERELNIDFSEPYFSADQSLLVKKDGGITSLADTAGQTIAVQSGTTGKDYATANAPEGASVKEFDDPGALFLALESGDAVAVLQDIVVNGERILNDDSVTVVETFPTDEFYGFAVKEEGKEPLLEAVNDALATLRSNGRYDALYAEWFS
jgi:polar amino acid transport system substrate-binding protein